MEVNKLSMEQRVNVGIQDLKSQIRDAAMEKKGAVAADTARGYLETAGQLRQIGNFEAANNKLLLGFESLQNLYTSMVKNAEIPKLLRDAGKAVGGMMIAVGYVSPFTWMGACDGPSSNYGVPWPDGGSSSNYVWPDGGARNDGGIQSDGGVRDGGTGYCSPSDTRCLNDHSLYVCYDTQKPGLTVECKDGWHCEDASCRPPQGQRDPDCSGSSRSACVVTDIFDFGEDTRSHGYERTGWSQIGDSSCNDPLTPSCGDDSGEKVGWFCEQDYGHEDLHIDTYVAVTMNIIPPPQASYYEVDLKLSGWSACNDCHPVIYPGIEILFGDDQKKDITYYPTWEASKCTYMNNIATFSSAGITSSNVRMNIKHRPCDQNDDDSPYFAMTKMRLWSCECNQ